MMLKLIRNDDRDVSASNDDADANVDLALVVHDDADA